MINGILAQVWLPVDPLGPCTQSVDYFLVSDCVIGKGMFGSWENPCTGSLACHSGKAK